MRILAVDWGEKRVGLAVSDESGRFALPRGFALRRSDREAIGKIVDLARQEGAETILLGLPLKMQGGEGDAAGRVRKLSTILEKASGLPVVLRDERLTTQEARERLRAAGVKPRDIPEKIDETAAVILLEDYFSELSGKAKAHAAGPQSQD
ncbi:MAG: Holliday junction resolvase RuvX [Bdellovibrionota bacterium]